MCVLADPAAVVEHPGFGMRTWLVPRPGLFGLLSRAERVVHVSAPAGSGKTFLLRSWIAAEGLGDRVAWVSVGRGERDEQAFWLSVLDSLRRTRVGAERVRELTAAPGLDGATVVRRLLEDVGSLDAHRCTHAHARPEVPSTLTARSRFPPLEHLDARHGGSANKAQMPVGQHCRLVADWAVSERLLHRVPADREGKSRRVAGEPTTRLGRYEPVDASEESAWSASARSACL
jgi:hypothetical protein